MTGLFAALYWVILFLMVGLFTTRRYVSRYVLGVLVFAIGRYFLRAVVFQMEGPDSDHILSMAIANDWVILAINLVVITVLLTEMIVGTKCWRIYKITKRKRRREKAKITG